MKTKKIISFAAALAMIGANFCGTSLFNTNPVSAIGIVGYDIEATLEDYTIMLPEGRPFNDYCLLNNGISIKGIPSIYHDMTTDPECDTTTKGDPEEVSLKSCDIEYPEVVQEGENTIKISYHYMGVNAINASTELKVNVKYCDPQVAENQPPLVKDKKVTFGLTDSVVKPGETTYVDINTSENAGFVAMTLNMLYDEKVFTLESMSVMPEFAGDDYHFYYSLKRKAVLFMNDCSGNFVQTGSSLIRLAFKVKDDAPEGDYTIGMEKGDSEGIVALDSDRHQYIPDMNFTTGTITVDSKQDPKTNVAPMPLGRVYAMMDDSETTNKTGDLTGDGKINAMDALKLAKYLLGTSETANNGDTNEDGRINIVDYMKLKTYIIGE